MKKINPIDDPYEYKLEIVLGKICATQNADFDKRTERNKLGFQKEAETIYNARAVEQNPEEDKTKKPVVRRKTNKKRKDKDLILTHCFMRNNGHIHEPIGGTFGHMKTVLRRASAVIGLALYKRPAVELIRFEPELVNLGKDEDIALTPVLEPRSRGKTRELVYYETVTNRKFQLTMKVSKTCPLTSEEVRAILTAIKDYDGFGASRRGVIESIRILD